MTSSDPDLTYDARTAAMQAEFIRLEETFAAAWVESMRNLAGERLPQHEFTARRMLLLKSDLKNRKRELAKLRWKYDGTGRRRADLVERDIRSAEKWARAAIDEYKQRNDKHQQELAEERDRRKAIQDHNRRARQQHTDPVEQRADIAASILGELTPVPVAPPKPVVRSLEGVKPGRIDMISKDTGIDDLTTATDDDIIDAYVAKFAVPEDVAREYLALLQPDQ